MSKFATHNSFTNSTKRNNSCVRFVDYTKNNPFRRGTYVLEAAYPFKCLPEKKQPGLCQ